MLFSLLSRDRIRRKANNSKDIFLFRIKFVILYPHLPVTAGMSSEGDGADGWITTYWKALSRFVFGQSNYHNREANKNIVGVTATGCSIYSP